MESPKSVCSQEELVSEIRAMAPWHHDIALTPDLSTGRVFSETGRLLPPENQGVSLISPREKFLRRLQELYPAGMSGKSFLDCACNAGGYCFWAREQDVARAVGFDVRKHWIDQAKFVLQHRQVAPVDNIEFHEMDLYDLPQRNWEPFDLVYFSGIFYHLPDPITGLKIAADLTRDVLVLNTSMDNSGVETLGLKLSIEGTEPLMSGVHELAWLPNNPETLYAILRWMGFREMVLAADQTNPTSLRRRVEIYAAREPGRLDGIKTDLKT
ncbi:MAG: methyltransferase domain-containing protein [Pirellulaceae bacterium]|nr:methyltransferase domain-containing protein [Pirellulaceae bacterium]